MVLIVVSLLPVLGGTHDVPFVASGVEDRIVHPIVLTVAHVVADLHVLENLRKPEERHAGAVQSTAHRRLLTRFGGEVQLVERCVHRLHRIAVAALGVLERVVHVGAQWSRCIVASRENLFVLTAHLGQSPRVCETQMTGQRLSKSRCHGTDRQCRHGRRRFRLIGRGRAHISLRSARRPIVWLCQWPHSVAGHTL